uniref:Uncharacterized protein n=1 Tax=Globodera rostochiensis TaxID=31243 RepID=A0A914GWH6_GLORO
MRRKHNLLVCGPKQETEVVEAGDEKDLGSEKRESKTDFDSEERKEKNYSGEGKEKNYSGERKEKRKERRRITVRKERRRITAGKERRRILENQANDDLTGVNGLLYKQYTHASTTRAANARHSGADGERNMRTRHWPSCPGATESNKFESSGHFVVKETVCRRAHSRDYSRQQNSGSGLISTCSTSSTRKPLGNEWAREILSNVQEVKCPVTVCGDVHGQFQLGWSIPVWHGLRRDCQTVHQRFTFVLCPPHAGLEPNQHVWVNHRVNFVDPETGLVECKKKNKEMSETMVEMLPSYLDEFILGQKYGKTTTEAFNNSLSQISFDPVNK